MRWRTSVSFGLAAGFLLLAAAAGGVRAEEVAPPREPLLLDEWTLGVHGAADSAQIAAGVTLGEVLQNGLQWFYGARASLLQVRGFAPKEGAFALGGIVGLGWKPERSFSPVASLGVDWPIAFDAPYGLLTTVSAGVRVRVTPEWTRHWAMTFSVYYTTFFGQGAASDESDAGLVVTYSKAFATGK